MVFHRKAEATAKVTLLGISLGPKIVVEINNYYNGDGLWDSSPGGKASSTINVADFTFIPTVSALDLQTTDPYYKVTDIAGFNSTKIPNYVNGVNVPKLSENVAYTHSNSISPFDAVWANVDNTSHAFLEESYEFLLEEIAPKTLVIQDKVITGNFSFNAGDAVIIGSNVSPAFPAGPVTFVNGSTGVISSEDDVYLNNVVFQSGSNVTIGIGINSYGCQ